MAFRRTFGQDLDALERDWHRFMADIRTPLEQQAPGRATPSPKPNRPGVPPDRWQPAPNGPGPRKPGP